VSCTTGLPGADTGNSTGDPLAPTAVLITSDYQVGALATLDLEDYTLRDTQTTIHSDAAVSVQGNTVYQINRLGMDSIRIYNAGSWSSPLIEFSTGESSNPQDALLCGEHLAVSLYARDYLGIFDPDSGEEVRQVDLSAWSDADGSPEANDLVVIEDRLYIALQQFEEWASDQGTILAIDCTTWEVLDSWTVGPSPSLYSIPGDSSALWVRTGIWWAADGDLRRLNLETGSLESARITEAELGEDLYGLAVSPTGRLVYASYDFADTESHSLRCIDPDEGLAIDGPNLPNFFSTMAALDSSRILVSTAPPWSGEEAAVGLLELDANDCTANPSDEWIQTTLQVTDIAITSLDTDAH